MSAEHGDSQVHADDHATHGPPAPPEPKTPMWLTALGAVLFLTAGLWLAVSSSGSAAKDADPSDAGAAAALGGDAAPSAAGGGGAEQNAQLQQMLQQMKK
jgi:hypothetical protein